VSGAAQGPGSSGSRSRAETIRVIAHVDQPALTLQAGSRRLMSPEVGGSVARGPGGPPQRHHGATWCPAQPRARLHSGLVGEL
jgi:hypothetical protein